MVKSLIQKFKRKQAEKRGYRMIAQAKTRKAYGDAYVAETKRLRIQEAKKAARRDMGITTNAPKQSFNQLAPLGSLGTSTKPTRKVMKKAPAKTKYVVVGGKAYPVGYQKPTAKKPTLKTAKKIAGPMDKSYSLYSADQGFNKGVARKRNRGIY